LEPRDQDEDQQILHLYDCYAAKLQSYATTLVRDTSAAQDAVQEVFLRYALTVREGRSIATPKAWLFRVMRNYILDSMKAAYVKNEIGMDIMPDKVDDTGDPEQQYASVELTRQILSSLTPREMECLRLRSHGLRYHEIANVLSIRPGTVAALLSRCSARIQHALEPEGATPPGQVVTKDGYAS
jgi:RNA polymerase sigma factor (sigma-70 family)